MEKINEVNYLLWEISSKLNDLQTILKQIEIKSIIEDIKLQMEKLEGEICQ